MGKKSRYKKIKRLASELTPLVIGRNIGERIVGKDLIAEGVLSIKTGEIKPDTLYKRVQVRNVPVNHGRNLRKIYDRHGDKGVLSYVSKVSEVVAKSKQKQDGEPIEQNT